MFEDRWVGLDRWQKEVLMGRVELRSQQEPPVLLHRFPGGYSSTTLKVASSPSVELAPTVTLKVPGSTTKRIWRS